MFGDGGYAYDSYADALKKNPSLGMTKDQYYESLASAHNIQIARDNMQLQGYGMAYLYARLAIPTANLISAAVMAPAAIPPGSVAYTAGSSAPTVVIRAVQSEEAAAAEANAAAAVTKGFDPYIRVTSQVPYTSASKVLNLGGTGEFPGAINMNNGVAGIPNLLNRNMLEPWPLAGDSMEAVVGNRLPGFTVNQYEFVANESFRVLRAGGQIRIFSNSASAQSIKTAVSAAGFQNVTVQGMTVIGTK